MKVSGQVLIAARYELAERLGTGAMGEVWRAQDTRFESKVVAVKFLREDETLKEDAVHRDRLMTRVDQLAARGELTLQAILEALAGSLSSGPIFDGLRAKAIERLGPTGPYQADTIGKLFDELANDPTFNDNARMRAKMRRLFKDEANAVANLRHDNIVSIFDYGDHEGIPYLVMDYIDGRTLYQVIQANEPLSRARRLRLIEDLCAGLAYAHKRKLVHRDIKPANLIIDSSTDSLKILDFGVVRRIGSQSTVGIPVGTFCYMSPEQTKGSASLDHRSDIFAVGLVLYEILTGRKAFPPGKSLGDLVARIQRDPPAALSQFVPNIEKGIADIIDRATRKEPENRYQDLSLMARDLARIRTKLEAEEPDRTHVPQGNEQTILVKPQKSKVTDLLMSAQRAFATGDLAGAKATLDRARDLDSAAPELAAFEQKLNAAIEAARIRKEEDEQPTLPLNQKRKGSAPARRDEKAILLAQLVEKMRAAEKEGDVRLAFDVAQSIKEASPDHAEALGTEKRVLPEIVALDNLAAAQRLVREGKVDAAIERLDKVRGIHAKLEQEWKDLKRRRDQLIALHANASGETIKISRADMPIAVAPPPPPVRAEPPAPAVRAEAPPPARVGAEPPPHSAPAPPNRAPVAPVRAEKPVIRPPAKLSQLTFLVAAALLIVIVGSVAAYFAFRGRQQTPPETTTTSETPQPPSPAPESSPPPPTPAPAPADQSPPPPILSTQKTPVTIDIRPWARVRIVPAAAESEVPSAPLYAPFTVDLASGDYTLECENGGVTRSAKFPLKVAEGKPQFVTRTMPGFDAAKIVEGLLSREQ